MSYITVDVEVDVSIPDPILTLSLLTEWDIYYKK